MEKGEIIGRGARALVYALPDGKALKLYNPTEDQAFIKHIDYEAWLGRAVHETGIASPAVYDTVYEDGAPGIIFERIDGREMLRELFDHPERAREYGAQMAELHAEIHKRTIPGLPRAMAGLRPSLAHSVIPSEFADLGDIRAEALRTVDSLSDGDRLCHGDFHPLNIMMSSRGPVTIDWMNACLCNPIADVARTLLILKMLPAFISAAHVAPEVAEAVTGELMRAYLARYADLRPFDQAELAAWELPLAVARIGENLPDEWPRLHQLIASHLS